MTAGMDKTTDDRLLKATLSFVANHPGNEFDGFREPFAAWGEDWSGVEPAYLAASDLLAETLSLSLPGTAEHDLMRLYVNERASRHWEQSYTSADKAVEAGMLAGYGFTEIVGKCGPFVSRVVRAGIGIFPAGIDYPAHRHAAEEIYAILAGSAFFRLGEDAARKRSAGDVVHITSQLVHGFTMRQDPLVVFYIWKGGDLREKSTFV